MSDQSPDYGDVDPDKAAQLDAADSGQEAGEASAPPPDPMSAVIEKHDFALEDAAVDQDDLRDGAKS